MSIDHRTGGLFNQHHHRMHRSARHIVHHMRRTGRGYSRASVLVAQVRALEYAVNLRDTNPSKLPTQASVAAGQRVRIGHDTRALLDRLLVSRNLRVQQALVKEIGAQVRKRIKVHRDRSQRMKKARDRIQQYKSPHYTRTSRPRSPGAVVRPRAVFTPTRVVPDIPARTERTRRRGLRPRSRAER